MKCQKAVEKMLSTTAVCSTKGYRKINMTYGKEKQKILSLEKLKSDLFIFFTVFVLNNWNNSVITTFDFFCWLTSQLID